MSYTDVLRGLSSEEIKEVRAIIQYFAHEKDKELAEVFARLPVHDIMAIQTKYIKGKYFVPFANTMRLIDSYEIPISQEITLITLILNKPNLTTKDINQIKYKLKQTLIFKNQLDIQKKNLNNSNGVKTNPIEFSDISDYKLAKLYPKVMIYLDDPESNISKAEAIAEMKKEDDKARNRRQAARRREFRKAIVRNHQYILELFYDTLEGKYSLHLSRLDRVVIDVYHKELLTFDHFLKKLIKRKMRDLNKDLSIKRLPHQNYIDALAEVAEEEADQTIDDIVKEYEKIRRLGLAEGVAYDGKVIMEGDYYKAILVVDPKKAGAPVRLRLIVNVQLIILHELFEKYPEKEKYYKKHTWLEGSEINFILPDDYDYYYEREQSICDLVEMTAKNLFFEEIGEHLNYQFQAPQNVIVNITQWEVCWEEEFSARETDDPDFSTYPCPGLAKHLDRLVHKYHPYTKAYARFKVDIEQKRPSFNCDIPGMNPEYSMMQFKVYPKYRNPNGSIGLRSEIIPTRFFKEFGKDAPDSLAIAQKVLSNPEYCREVVERLLQLELLLNGVEGLGYNERFRKPTPSEDKEWLHSLVKRAIFGNKAGEFEVEYQAFLDTGKLPKSLSLYYRKKMKAMDLERFMHRVLNKLDNNAEEGYEG